MSTARAIRRFTTLAGALLLAAAPGAAQPTLTVATGRGDYLGSAYGGGQWHYITAQIDGAFGAGRITVRTDLSNLADLLSRERLWLDQRMNGQLTPTELANVAAFIATGRRVVIVGEHGSVSPGISWAAWNQQVATLVGGSFGPGSISLLYGPTARVLTHELTAGVPSVFVSAGRTIVGGEPLFADNFATLWGAQRNVLTIFDTGLWYDPYLPFPPPNANAAFGANVARWLAAPVVVAAAPEPATWGLVASGLLGIGGAARRRRSV